MVNVGKLAMQRLRGHVIGDCRFLGGIEGAEMNAFPVVANLGNPATHTGIVGNSLISASIVLSWALIVLLLAARCDAKILVSVVQCVAILVVSFEEVAISQAEDAPMQKFKTISICSLDVTNGVIRAHRVDRRIPSEVSIFLEPMRADSRDKTFAQRNFTVGLFRGCHVRSNQRIGFGGTAIPTPPFYQKEAVIT